MPTESPSTESPSTGSPSTESPAGSPPPPPRGYPPPSTLRRSRVDRRLAGVAGGLGRYAGIDPLVFRILFVVLALFGGSGLLLYALGWLCLPEDGQVESEGRRLFRGRPGGSLGSVLALVAVVVVVVVAVLVTGASLHSGLGLGGFGLLAVVAAAALLLRAGHRAQRGAPPGTYLPGPAPAGASQVFGPVPPPVQPGGYGQTPGTAYAPPGTPPPYPRYVEPVPPEPPVPPERSVLGRATLAVALVVTGLLMAWNLATSSDVPARVIVAAALGVVSVGLLVGAVAGRARGLVVWGLLLTLLAAVASLPDLSLRGGVGDRAWTPDSAAGLRPAYRLGVGSSELDLSRLQPTGTQRPRVEVRQGVGQLRVVVPPEVLVRVHTQVGVGELRLPRRRAVEGRDLAGRAVLGPAATGTPVLVVDAHLGVGSLEVRRAAS